MKYLNTYKLFENNSDSIDKFFKDNIGSIYFSKTLDGRGEYGRGEYQYNYSVIDDHKDNQDNTVRLFSKMFNYSIVWNNIAKVGNLKSYDFNELKKDIYKLEDLYEKYPQVLKDIYLAPYSNSSDKEEDIFKEKLENNIPEMKILSNINKFNI